jgi:3',5'-cyclic AMP phosphodiesterase CpdA
MQKTKRVIKKVILVAGLILMSCLAGLYLYTHQPLDHIPSDPESSDNITFFALGDQGSGEPAQWRVAHGMEMLATEQKDLDFVVLLGDNFYTRELTSVNSPEWMSRFEHLYSGAYLDSVPFYAILGNHDHVIKPEIQIEYSKKHMASNRWRMPDWYYSADFGKVNDRPILRIVFIDTSLDHDGLVKEAGFIKDKFADSAPIWKIVVGHHPVRDYGKHADETAEMDSIILPALQQAHVDLYLCGHDHNQQVIAREGEPFYFISGAGGANLYSVKTGAPDLLFSKSEHGFLGLSIDKDTLKVGHYDADGGVEVRYKIDRSCAQGKVKCLQPMSH